ncbi:MAG TPA: NADPH-dependent glutamate synthase [Candidatus Onthovivens sp.]|nr:NADPH-dependent glutamate synthase [Candidatus Onthovivens sp.]
MERFKINPSFSKNKDCVQDPLIRSSNFDEVSLGYTNELALSEALRCLECKDPRCVKGCPVSINIPGFIHQIKEGKIKEANDIILEASNLGSICGRVCPQEIQCEKDCVRGLIKGREAVAIGRLERFVSDYAREHNLVNLIKPQSNNIKVAVIGSGPSGLTCAASLAKLGYDVTIFEGLHLAGGVLVYGIPEFRLPKKIVQHEVDNLLKLGVKIKTNMIIGKVYSLDELIESEGFRAIFVGTGAGLPSFLGIEGENFNGVLSANEYLTRINLMKAYDKSYDTPYYEAKKVAVIGGGNVAMDAARVAKRLGAKEVYIIYRRSEEELPARKEEVEHAKEEGIIFKLLTNPKRILGDENYQVSGIEVSKMSLGEVDSSGRRRPVLVPNSEFIIEVDQVIEAIGTSPNPLIKNTTKGLDVNKHGCIITFDESGKTTKEGVYAGGDVVTGAATVILAMGAGKKAAEAIDKYLKNS